MIKVSWCKMVSTLGPVGYQKGGGTLASLLTVPLVLVIHSLFVSARAHMCIIAVALSIALYCVYRCLGQFYGQHDPTPIVIDEVVGCLITFVGICITPGRLLCGFLLFRFFDIFKIAGIAYLERIPGTWGIIADDVVAAVYACIMLHILIAWHWL